MSRGGKLLEAPVLRLYLVHVGPLGLCLHRTETMEVSHPLAYIFGHGTVASVKKHCNTENGNQLVLAAMLVSLQVLTELVYVESNSCSCAALTRNTVYYNTCGGDTLTKCIIQM